MSVQLLTRILGAAGRREIPPISAAAWTPLADQARTQGVGPLLLNALRRRNAVDLIPQEIRTTLKIAERKSARRVLLLTLAYAELAQALEAIGIRLVALKGLHLAWTAYPSPAARPMSDLDVLVTRDQALAVERTARDLGFRPTHGSSTAIDLATAHHLKPLRRNGVRLEIHWRIFPPAQRGDQSTDVDMTGVMARVVPCQLGNYLGAGLCLEDLLLHVSGHTSHHHLFEQRLRPLWDIAFVLNRFGDRIDWAALVQRAQDWGTTKGTALTFALAQDFTTAVVPQVVMDRLGAHHIPADVLAAARAMIARPEKTIKIGHHTTRLLDTSLPLRTRLQLLRDRAFLSGSARSGESSDQVSHSVARRLSRVVSLAFEHTRGLARLSADQRRRFRTLAATRNILSGWLNPLP